MSIISSRRLDYETWESFSYEQHSQKLTKTAWVYLPYGNELLNDLIPAVEGRYHTWADYNTSPDNLKATRDHRGFGGFSMAIITVSADRFSSGRNRTPFRTEPLFVGTFNLNIIMYHAFYKMNNKYYSC